MPTYFKSISGAITSSIRHSTGTEEQQTQDKNGKIIYCSEAESPWMSKRKVKLVTINFNSNGGTGAMESKQIYSGIYTLPECEFIAPTEKTFAGWSFTSSGPVITTEKIEVKTNTTLYAIWAAKKYKISFSPDSGYGPSGSGKMSSVELPNPIEKPECTFTPAEGYIFKNWSKTYDPSGSVTPIRRWPLTVTGDTTLYAMWDKLYTISFNPNGGSGYQNPIIHVPGIVTLPTESEVTLTPPASHKFKGWSDDPSGTGEILTEVTISESDIELFAIWEIVDDYYHINYYANGGVGEQMPEQKVSKTLPMLTFRPCSYTNGGKFFNGWNEDPTAESGAFPGKGQMVNSNKDFYATWSDTDPNAYLTFDPNGGIGEMTPISGIRKYAETKIIPTCTFTNPGKVFDHWNDSYDDTGTSYIDGGTITLDADICLYAFWSDEV